MTIKIKDIISIIEQSAPLSLQENYDNCGLLVGNPEKECTGVLLCLDASPAIVSEAAKTGCNLIVAHHPIIFKGLKKLNGSTIVEQTVIDAIKNDIAIYASHTAMDNAPAGVSAKMASMLGLQNCSVLDPHTVAEPITENMENYGKSVGSGVFGDLPREMNIQEFVSFVKRTFNAEVARCSRVNPDLMIKKVALCGGSGGFLINKAMNVGAEAMITSDVKYHDFADCEDKLLIVDIGHFETELCITSIFYEIISKKFPNFALRYAEHTQNPVIYM